jgi:hypothetical protein
MSLLKGGKVKMVKDLPTTQLIPIEIKRTTCPYQTGSLKTNFKNINSLFLVYPFSFKGKLIQYLGRILHSKESIRSVYDYRDVNVSYLDKMFKKRKSSMMS